MKIHLFSIFKVSQSPVSFAVPLKSSQGKPERLFLLPTPRAPATCMGGESPPCHARTHTPCPCLGVQHAVLKRGASETVCVPKMYWMHDRHRCRGGFTATRSSGDTHTR